MFELQSCENHLIKDTERQAHLPAVGRLSTGFLRELVTWATLFRQVGLDLDLVSNPPLHCLCYGAALP
jgi:hypothetical protein